MIAWIKDILPIVGIGVIFALLYELVLWISVKLDEKEIKKTKKQEQEISKIKNLHFFKKEKSIA
ncbi:hypothetical protein [Lactococcus protaetiae]|uniref:hypothetical protein n=1 Tax=Lactococcus protaetiae TaxID=2592653 RepID=UPI001CC20674|nr:hypothetical protein [Lactococcus protaetiae]MCL2113787.1 hypothetical protein [Streptococcaceae bacterium]